MKKMYGMFVGVLAVILFASVANAALIGSVFHDYGNGAGKVDPSGSDSLFADHVLVSDQSSGRFSDSFDLSGLNAASIDYFDLTISFAETNRSVWFVPVEDWRVRPGGGDSLLDINRVGSSGASQTFRIGAGIDMFSEMVAANEFILWFAEKAFGSNEFKLYDAKVDVYGTAATPIPGAVWLLGSGLMGLVGLRRRYSN